MDIFNDWPKQISEYLVSFVVCCQYSNAALFWCLNSTLNTKLDVAASGSCLLFHISPSFPSKMLFKKTVAFSFEFRVGDDRDSLWCWTYNSDSIFFKFMFCYEVRKVLNLQKYNQSLLNGIYKKELKYNLP